jgi:hypothetical protein
VRWLSAVLILNACGGPGATPEPQGSADATAPDAPVRTLEQACTDVATVACGEFDTCPALWFEFGDAAKCNTGMRARCLRDGRAPGVVNIISHFDHCSSKVAGLACERRYRDLWSCLAAPGEHVGTLADGSKCWTHSQCQSGSCGDNPIPIEARCGTCRPTPRVGDKCTGDPECFVNSWRERDTALRCDVASQRCVLADGEGEACSAESSMCDGTMSCVDGKCTHALMNGVFARMGEPCARYSESNPDSPDSRPFCRGGSWCNIKYVCAPARNIGDLCNEIGGEYFACGRDAVCQPMSGGARCSAIEELCR